MTEPVGKMFVHSCHITKLRDGGDAVVIKEHTHHADGRVEPTLSVIRNPKRRFYVSKPEVRKTHDEKREWEDLHNLDEHTVFNHEIEKEAFKALEGYYPRGHVPMRTLNKSPYLYGADISIETIAKASYANKFEASGLKPQLLTTGFFDTETDMLSDDYGLIMATITHENNVYTSVLRKNLFKIDEKGNKAPATVDELLDLAHRSLNPDVIFTEPSTRKLLKGREFKLHVHVADTPIQILEWIFARLHENKTDFMGVWNLPFDMQVVLDTCKAANVDPADILCPPELPKELRRVNFQEQLPRKNDQFHRRWHWLYAPGYAKMYDAMCLYSILRIVSGFESGGYSLDNVLRNNKISDGKLKFADKVPDAAQMSSADWHRHMQSKFPLEYIVYNMFDTIGLQVQEWKNNDVQGMVTLIGNSPLQNFAKQTRRSADALYFKCLDRGKVTATTSTAEDDEDIDIAKQGGAVLPPERTFGAGLRVLSECPLREAYVHRHVDDIDLSAVYPNIDMACNISRETKLSTIIGISGHDPMEVRTYASMLISPYENAVPIGNIFYKLPDYQEMDAKFGEFLRTKDLPKKSA